jgi:hypothetical protein
MIEKNFALSHLTTAHSEPDMTKTFKAVYNSFNTTKPHIIIPGRKSEYVIPDAISKGQSDLARMGEMETVASGEVIEGDDVELTDGQLDIYDVLSEITE